VLSLNGITGGQRADAGHADSVIIIQRMGLAMYPQHPFPRARRKNDGFLYGSIFPSYDGSFFIEGIGHGFFDKIVLLASSVIVHP
jgi:hypothetical protein